MPNAHYSISDDNLNAIASNEKRINSLKGDAKEAQAEAKMLKMNSYSMLISGICGVELTAKSNLPSSVSASVKGDLMDIGGLTESMAQKMLKNAVGARNVFDLHSANTTPELVADTLEAQGIDSEAKLIKAVSGDIQKSKVQLLVEKVAGRRSTKKNDKGERVEGDAWLGGLSYEELDEFNNLLADQLRVRAEMEKAAQEAADKQQAENEAINEMTNQMDAVA